MIRLSKTGSFKGLLLELKRPVKLKKRKNLTNWLNRRPKSRSHTKSRRNALLERLRKWKRL